MGVIIAHSRKNTGALLEVNLDRLAVESGYKKRGNRKITPKMFLDNLMHNASCDVNKSLNSLSIDIKQNYNVDVSKQGVEMKDIPRSLTLSEVCPWPNSVLQVI